ncbi:MAG: hypothetical protein ACLFV2_00505 [Desulfurivibrionaceae bacterium]
MNFFLSKKNKRLTLLSSKLLSVLAGATLLLASPLYAQPGQSAPHSSGGSGQMQQNQEAQQKLMEMKDLQKKQQEIQKEVLENNPELKKQEEELRQIVQETLDKHLDEQNVDIERLQDLQAKLQGGEDLEEEKQAELEDEFRQKVEKFRKAREKALTDPEITEKREALIKGIEEKSPQAVKIGQKLEELQQEIQQSFNQPQQ